MRLFLDTEFTDFVDCDLISIGIVSEDGREFYAERTDYDRHACSDFVNEAVLPLLGRGSPLSGAKAQISAALRTWLAQFGQVQVCSDSIRDWDLFAALAGDAITGKLPEGMWHQNINGQIDERDIKRYWQDHGRHEHHALHDARALAFAWQNSPFAPKIAAKS